MVCYVGRDAVFWTVSISLHMPMSGKKILMPMSGKHSYVVVVVDLLQYVI